MNIVICSQTSTCRACGRSARRARHRRAGAERGAATRAARPPRCPPTRDTTTRRPRCPGGAPTLFITALRDGTIVFHLNHLFFSEASRGAGAQSVTLNRLVVGSVPTRGDEIFT